MTDQIEPGHVMSREEFSRIEAQKPASESTKHRRCLVDDIRSMMGTPEHFERIKAQQEGK